VPLLKQQPSVIVVIFVTAALASIGFLGGQHSFLCGFFKGFLEQFIFLCDQNLISHDKTCEAGGIKEQYKADFYHLHNPPSSCLLVIQLAERSVGE
jgi:hypothetical protein